MSQMALPEEHFAQEFQTSGSPDAFGLQLPNIPHHSLHKISPMGIAAGELEGHTLPTLI